MLGATSVGNIKCRASSLGRVSPFGYHFADRTIGGDAIDATVANLTFL